MEFLTEEQKQLVNSVREMLKSLTSDEIRRDVLIEIREEFCIHCGEYDPNFREMQCQCTNDE